MPKLGRREAAIVHRFFHAEVPGSVATPVKPDTLAADPSQDPEPA